MLGDMQETKKSKNPVVVAAAGIVIGAASAAAITASIVHEPTRKMMGKKLNDAKVKVSKTINDLQKTSETIIKKTQNNEREVSGKEKHAEISIDIDSDHKD